MFLSNGQIDFAARPPVSEHDLEEYDEAARRALKAKRVRRNVHSMQGDRVVLSYQKDNRDE